MVIYHLTDHSDDAKYHHQGQFSVRYQCGVFGHFLFRGIGDAGLVYTIAAHFVPYFLVVASSECTDSTYVGHYLSRQRVR
jgi:hypothetical protein